ncbi:bestrophin family protein [Geminocystis sp. NIES-3709]|uniref:bestrophin family protein n=1 Tax=Geminocystis sp. NIES-3709 TaxID=1617448 RepID=UPI000824B013|nr:bestrophin family ion channel [Geminocystis sp. NIES-3709]
MKFNNFRIKRKSWFRALFNLNSSILPVVWEKAVFFGVLSFFVCFANHFGYSIAKPALTGLIPTIVLSLLLAFRTNSANDRFWEGRKLWGMIVNTLRNLAWQIWVNVREITPDDKQRKIQNLKLLTVFAITTKNHLRGKIGEEEIKPFLSDYHYHHLKTSQHLPLQVAAYLGEYLYKESQQKNLNQYQLSSMQELINILIDMVGGCERILKTPIPYSYSIHLRQLLFLYCVLLPFQCVDQLKWGTIPFVIILAYVLYGIEAIALEIENPFGTDKNDLPLDQICQTVNQNIQDFIMNQNR